MSVCPHCGYCPTCGRRNSDYGFYPYPWYRPYWSGGTITGGQTSGLQVTVSSLGMKLGETGTQNGINQTQCQHDHAALSG